MFELSKEIIGTIFIVIIGVSLICGVIDGLVYIIGSILYVPVNAIMKFYYFVKRKKEINKT